MRKYVVGASVMTKEQEQEFIKYLEGSKVAWWHWIKGMWLIVDFKGSLSITDIRDALKKASPKARNLVFEVTESGSWAGAGPKMPDKSMFNWIRNVWDSTDKKLE